MNPRIPQSLTEQDILDLVEGNLPPDRTEVVRAALRSDPALVGRVEAMMADRRRVREHVHGAQRRAPAGLTQSAVTQVEQEDLLGSPELHIHTKSFNARRLAAGIGLVLLIGGAFSGALWMLAPAAAPRAASSNHVATTATQPSAGSRPAYIYELPPEVAPTKAGDPQLPIELAARNPHDLSIPTPSRDPGQGLSALPKSASADANPPSSSAEVSDSLLTLNADTRHPLGDNGSIQVGGMALADAAELAVQGRLGVRVLARDVEAYARRAPTLASAGSASKVIPQPLETTSRVRAFTVELNTRADAQLSAVQDSLASLAQRLAGDGFGPRAQIVFTQLEPSAATGAAIPSVRADDVLWWARPISNWEWTLSVRARIEIVAAPASP